MPGEFWWIQKITFPWSRLERISWAVRIYSRTRYFIHYGTTPAFLCPEFYFLVKSFYTFVHTKNNKISDEDVKRPLRPGGRHIGQKSRSQAKCSILVTCLRSSRNHQDSVGCENCILGYEYDAWLRQQLSPILLKIKLLKFFSYYFLPTKCTYLLFCENYPAKIHMNIHSKPCEYHF